MYEYMLHSHVSVVVYDCIKSNGNNYRIVSLSSCKQSLVFIYFYSLNLCNDLGFFPEIKLILHIQTSSLGTL